MPVRKCKNAECKHPYWLHKGSELNQPAGACTATIRDANGSKIKQCPCRQYDHDPASGPFG